jgi:hypothetical protein
MEENKSDMANTAPDVQSIVRGAIEEYMRFQSAKTEPAHKLELVEERKKREQLERRLNELVEENRRSRAMAEEVDRGASIRAELQRLGVSKVDLAFKAVKDEIVRAEDGRLVARTDTGEVTVRDYLSRFLHENPELLPGRIQGGSGAGPGHGEPLTQSHSGVDLNSIRPGMSAEELDKVRREIARIARQTIRGA